MLAEELQRSNMHKCDSDFQSCAFGKRYDSVQCSHLLSGPIGRAWCHLSDLPKFMEVNSHKTGVLVLKLIP